MKILLVHPGSSVSTHDVWAGIDAGLRAEGHEVASYALDQRITVAGAWLKFVLKKAGQKPTPSSADVLYKAGEELVTRALRLQPDWVVIVSAMYLHPDVLVLMRRAGLRVACLFTESPYDDERQARLLPFLDVVWTNELTSADRFARSARLLPNQPLVRYLPHAWHPTVHTTGTPEELASVPAHDVVFVGTGFEERVALLSAVDWTGINFGLYGTWNLVGSRSKLRANLAGGYLDNRAASLLYQRAKIGLNLHRTSKGFGRGVPKIDHAVSLNPRAYELAALGCFTISDARDEVGRKFGLLVPTFTTPSELRALVDRWLSDDVGRKSARQALPNAVAHDTWHDRVRQMIADLAA